MSLIVHDPDTCTYFNDKAQELSKMFKNECASATSSKVTLKSLQEFKIESLVCQVQMCEMQMNFCLSLDGHSGGYCND